MKEKVIIIGAGGHGKVVADSIEKSGTCVAGFLDDNKELSGQFAGFPVLGTVGQFSKYKEYSFIIAIGDAVIRERIAKELTGVRWHTVIHPTASISAIDVEIGEGTVIMPNAVVNAGTRIGKHCIINSGAIVEHDNQIADFAHISVGAKLAGNVRIGKGTWIGIGASVNNNLSICAGCMVGAGAVVVKSIKEMGSYVGIPAKKVQEKNTGSQ